MTQRSMFWDLPGGGDAQVYDQSHLMDTFFRALLNGTGNRGPLKGWRDELEVTGTASPLSVAPGGAVVYGMFYDTDTGVQVGVPTPASGTATYLVVVQRSWAGQTCRVSRVDALTQAAGTTWDVPLASVEIDSTGTCTVTDAREFCTFSTDWPTNSVLSRHVADGAVTVGKIPDRTRWQTAGAGELEEHTTAIYAAAVWTGSGGIYGSPYDYWEFPDWTVSSLWAYFFIPPLGTDVLNLRVWCAPDTNVPAAPAAVVHWDYYLYYLLEGGTVTTTTTGATLVDQAGRSSLSIYRDTLATSVPAWEGQLVAVRLDRAGGQPDDTFGTPMRVLAIEIDYEADC